MRTTHHFLTEADIAALRPCVRQSISLVDEFAVVKAGRRTAGFIGVDSGKIEMLFVDPTSWAAVPDSSCSTRRGRSAAPPD